MVMGDDILSVALWRGYVTGRFYARPAEHDVAVVLSPSFRIASLPWESSVPLDQNEKAVGAFDALVNMLAEAGWERRSADVGSPWYRQTFRRPPPGSPTPRSRKANGSRIHIAEDSRDPRAAITHVAEPRLARPSNGHATDVVARKIIAALRSGTLTSSELCSRISHSTGVVRVARRELELAGLVQKAARPAGGSKRAIYWQLSLLEYREQLRSRDGERALHEVNCHE
jgi:hypothetical protein